MATPVVHDGVPVAVRERKNSLKHPEEEDTKKKRVCINWLLLQLEKRDTGSIVEKREIVIIPEVEHSKSPNVFSVVPENASS